VNGEALLEFPYPKPEGIESFALFSDDLHESRLANGGAYTEPTANLLIMESVVRAGVADSVLFFSSRMCDLVDEAHEAALAQYNALDAADQSPSTLSQLLEDAHLDLFEMLTAFTPDAPDGVGVFADSVGANLFRLVHDLESVDGAVLVRSSGGHTSIAACLMPHVDALHSFHLASFGAGHTEWASEVLTPFLHTLSKHAFKLRVSDELAASGVDDPAEWSDEWTRRLMGGELTLMPIHCVDVEEEPEGSNACGPAAVYFVEMLLRMLKQAAGKSDLNPIQVVSEVLRTFKVKQQQYLMMRPALSKRLLELADAFQQTKEAEATAP